jgi:hypothetical protein
MDSTGTDDTGDLGKEVRQSLLLLGISVGVTAVVTLAAQATLSLLG